MFRPYRNPLKTENPDLPRRLQATPCSDLHPSVSTWGVYSPQQDAHLRGLASHALDPVDTAGTASEVPRTWSIGVRRVSCEGIVSALREQGSYTLNYGMKAKKLANSLAITVEEAEALMAKYMDKWVAVRRYFEETEKSLTEDGYVYTYLGRRRFLPDIKSPLAYQRFRAGRQGANSVIQGCQPGSTKVLTRQGYLRLDAMPEKGEVWTGMVWAPYTLLNRGEWQLAEIHFDNGQVLTCDTRHKVLTCGPEEYVFKEFAELKEGDKVAFSVAQPLEYGERVDGVEDGDAFYRGRAGGSAAAQIPDWVWGAPLRDRLSYLAGLEVACGEYVKKSLLHPNRSFLQDVMILARTCGIVCVLEEGSPFSLRYHDVVGGAAPYASSAIRKLVVLDRRDTTYTLAVEHPSHRFDSEGVITKNTAAEIAKCAMLRLFYDKRLQAIGWQMLSQIHDELVCEGPEETKDEAKVIVKEAMEHPFAPDLEFGAPLSSSPAVGPNWYACK